MSLVTPLRPTTLPLRLETDEAARLRLQVEILQGRLDFFEDTVFGGVLQFPGTWKLTRTENRMLGILLALNIVTREAAMTAIYGDDPDREPDDKIIDMFVCKLRKKLRPHGVTISTQWGMGYSIDQPRRGELRKALLLTRPPWHRPHLVASREGAAS